MKCIAICALVALLPACVGIDSGRPQYGAMICDREAKTCEVINNSWSEVGKPLRIGGFK